MRQSRSYRSPKPPHVRLQQIARTSRPSCALIPMRFARILAQLRPFLKPAARLFSGEEADMTTDCQNVRGLLVIATLSIDTAQAGNLE